MTKKAQQTIWDNLEERQMLNFVEYKVGDGFEVTDEIIIPEEVYENTTILHTRFGPLPCLKVQDIDGNNLFLKISSKSLRRQIIAYLGEAVQIFRVRESWGYSYRVDEA